jgi:hypothetical protein
MSSKITNQVGTTLYVDDVKTFKNKKKVEISSNLNGVALTLLTRDTDRIIAEIGKIGSDGIVTPGEKKQLAREWASIQSQFSFASSQASTFGMNGQLVFTNVLDAYASLSTVMTSLLADMSTDSTLKNLIPDGSTFQSLFSDYYHLIELLNNEMFHYQTGLLNGLDDRTKCELHLSCSSGLALPDDGSSATLSVVLLQEGVDSTAEMSDSDFTWERNEDGWEPRTGKSITIDVTDLVDGKANFLCRFKHFYSESMYWYAVNFITVQRYASPIKVQINSTNGDKFRAGTLSTTLILTVFRGEVDITESVPATACRWRRKSSDLAGDEAWNTSSKAIAKKELELTPEDAFGRAVFYCDVDISQIQ